MNLMNLMNLLSLMNLRIAVVSSLLLAAVTARAQTQAAAAATAPPSAPTAAEINKVVDYYQNGVDGGPVLVEFQLCAKVARNPTTQKLACEGELSATAAKGTAVAAFVKFFAPKGGKYEDLKVKFLLNGEVRSTSDFSVTESFSGYSNYKQTTLSKPGTWDVQVLRGEAILATKTVKVE